ncbi:MAG: 16S rRNA (cytosine(1402)-N(4))-methyltransferase [Ignavibacteriales bacterium]|nr:16S rRNA (cytosine(1402)-N(4))-methyltransferase [Ignavibacteriales bacterium]
MPDGIYVDATFGRGGHSRLILSRLSGSARLIALDRDPAGRGRGAVASPTRAFTIEHTPFSRLRSARLQSLDIASVRGVLMDIGVSLAADRRPAARVLSFGHDAAAGHAHGHHRAARPRPSGWHAPTS